MAKATLLFLLLPAVLALVTAQPAKPFDPKNLFKIRSDFRKCASPLCGGYFVSSFSGETVCADGKTKESCYVAEIVKPDGTPLKLQPSFGVNEIAVARGEIITKIYGSFGNLGGFVLDELYKAATGGKPKSSGDKGEIFVGLQYAGPVTCADPPCADIDQYALGGGEKKRIFGVDLTMAGASKEEITQGRELIHTKGLISKGFNVNEPAQEPFLEITFKATQFYLPVGTKSSG